MTEQSLYGDLGVRRNASLKTIKAAHRALAKKHHPDVNRTGDMDRFRAIDTAYKVLRDPEKRTAYDETGAYSLGSVQTEMQKVICVMVDIYNRLLADGKAFDESVSIIDLMGNIVTENIARLNTAGAEIEDHIEKLLDLRRTISRDDDDVNLFARATDNHVKNKRTALGQINDQTHILELVRDELDNYSSFARAAQAVHMVWVMGDNSTATATGFV